MTFYIQAYKGKIVIVMISAVATFIMEHHATSIFFLADSPQFPAPWTPSDPVLSFDVKEELPIGELNYLEFCPQEGACEIPVPM